MLGRLKELTEINGVSGDEGQVRRYIKISYLNMPTRYGRTRWATFMRIRKALKGV